MKKNIFSIILVMIILFVAVGCEKKTATMSYPIVQPEVVKTAKVETPAPAKEETPATVEEVVTPVTEEVVVLKEEAEAPVIEEPVVEEPVIEEPVIEEPEVIEEPVIEEPVVEEPVVEEPEVIEEPAVEEPVIEEPVVEEPVIEEPVVEEPVVEEPVVVESVVEKPYVKPAIDVDGHLVVTLFPYNLVVNHPDSVYSLGGSLAYELSFNKAFAFNVEAIYNWYANRVNRHAYYGDLAFVANGKVYGHFGENANINLGVGFGINLYMDNGNIVPMFMSRIDIGAEYAINDFVSLKGSVGYQFSSNSDKDIICFQPARIGVKFTF